MMIVMEDFLPSDTIERLRKEKWDYHPGTGEPKSFHALCIGENDTGGKKKKAQVFLEECGDCCLRSRITVENLMDRKVFEIPACYVSLKGFQMISSIGAEPCNVVPVAVFNYSFKGGSEANPGRGALHRLTLHLW